MYRLKLLVAITFIAINILILSESTGLMQSGEATSTPYPITLEIRTGGVSPNGEVIAEVFITCPNQDCNFINTEIEFDPSVLRIEESTIIPGTYFGTNEADRSIVSDVRDSNLTPGLQVIQFSISKRNSNLIPETTGVVFTFSITALQTGTSGLVFTNQTFITTTRDIIPLLIGDEIHFSPTATPTLDIRIKAVQGVDVYVVPVPDSPIAGNFAPDTEFFVLGRVPDTIWLYLGLPDGGRAWAEGNLINFDVSVGSLAEAAPLTPTFTPSLTPSLTPTLTPSLTPTPTPEKVVNITTNNINIRSEARVGQNIITGVNAGISFAVLEEVQGEDGFIWYKIDLNGTPGYVRQDVIEVARILPDGTPEVISTANGASSCPRPWGINQTLRIKPPDGAVDVFLRQTASGRDGRYVKLQNRQEVFVIGGPTRNGDCWWRVQTIGLTPTVSGWVEEGSLRLP